jgi:hypothetical protein
MGVAMPHGRPAAHAAAKMVAPDGDPETSLCRAVSAVLKAVGHAGAERGADCTGVAA